MFQISATPIDIHGLKRALEDPGAGACVCFEGWVRNLNEGSAVVALDYEAYEPLAVKEGQQVLAEARERFELIDAVCQHRVGQLGLGDCAVWVGVTAAHRDAAFASCRFIIDEIKARLPIWKKEHYKDGVSEWVNCAKAMEPVSANPTPVSS
jgi:molybdopterin synthase catalytic subunit